MPSFSWPVYSSREERVAAERERYALRDSPYDQTPGGPQWFNAPPAWFDADWGLPDESVPLRKLKAGMLTLVDGWGFSADGTELPESGSVFTGTKLRMRYEGVDKLLFDSEVGTFQFDGSVLIGAVSGSEMQSDINSAGSAAAQAASDAAAAAAVAAAAQADADAAASAAATAQADADTANQALADWASDNVLSPVEKPDVILQYNTLIGEQAGIQSQADAYGVSRTTYDNAVLALVSYLAGLNSPVAWNNLSGTTTIVGSTFRAKFQDVYTARQALLNAIYATAKSLANQAQSTANSAASAASTAQSTANAAQSTANSAQSTANSAYNLANGAIQTGGFVSVNAQKQIIALNTQGITIGTAASGARVEMNSTGLAVYDSSGVARTWMDVLGFHVRRSAEALPQAHERIQFISNYGDEVGCIFAHRDYHGGLIVSGYDSPLFLEAGMYPYSSTQWSWHDYQMEAHAGGYIELVPGRNASGSAVVKVGTATYANRVLELHGFVRFGVSGPVIRTGSGAPSGSAAYGSLYLSTGGSLWFYQATGWRRIDNWAS